MPFNRGVYKKRHARFHSCAKCDGQFEEGEKIFKKFRVHLMHESGKATKTTGYYCRDCYSKLWR